MTRRPDETTEAYHARLARKAPSIDCAHGVVIFHFNSDEEARTFLDAILPACIDEAHG